MDLLAMFNDEVLIEVDESGNYLVRHRKYRGYTAPLEYAVANGTLMLMSRERIGYCNVEHVMKYTGRYVMKEKRISDYAVERLRGFIKDNA